MLSSVAMGRLAPLAVLAGLAQGRLGDPVADRPRLCAAEIVNETCGLLSPSGAGNLTQEAIQSILASTAEGVQVFWRDAGLSPEGLSCTDLCSSTVNFLKLSGRRLPPASDTGCYTTGGETVCDLDLAPATIRQLAAASSGRLPFFEGAPHKLGGGEAAAEATTFSYTSVDMAVRIAGLFRIYPALETGIRADAPLGPSIRSLGDPEELLSKRVQQSQTYVNLVLRTFPAHQTDAQVQVWFGPGALTGSEPRRLILSTMNSVANVMTNMQFWYPGDACTARTFAYVYPCAHSPLERDAAGRYNLYLCDAFWQVSEEQICTIVHESSHHRSACTKDVVYGPEACKELVREHPEYALINADNYGYFIRDVAMSFGVQ